jgi:phosphoribosyl-ATP pyrophosphohydrolase
LGEGRFVGGLGLFTLGDLEAIIARRADAGADSSYTASLLAKGPGGCARKLGEEAIETIIAGVSGDRTQVRKEAADLIYHLMVLLKASDVRLEEVMAELASRTSQSGHAEKAARGRQGGS